MMVGYLLKGGFICKSCLPDPSKCVPVAVPVFTENIGQYSQTCPICRTVIIKGPFDCELFGPAKDPLAFGWADMDALLSRDVDDDDWEAKDSIRREICERSLRAIIADKLSDREKVFAALGRILS